MDARQSLLRQLPAVDRLLRTPALAALRDRCPAPLLTAAAQEAVARLRQELLAATAPATVDLSLDGVAAQAARWALAQLSPTLQPVLNATGTVLHTNLGRAPLAAAAQAAVAAIADGYASLEWELDSGERGDRQQHVAALLCRLTGAEAALAVNNNAGAVLLALAALGGGREAVVSRGELVEIGGSFRLPEVMTAGGVRLREVGTTNRTRLEDYRAAIGDDTALLVKVHTSNYRIVGFTESVSTAELAGLAQQSGVPLLEDLGSGLLLDLDPCGLPPEPTVAAAVAAGVDVVTCSGDKLLGGPQAGLIVGRRAAIDRLRRHPLARALRCDKLTLAALAATLRLYLEPDRARREIPVLRLLTRPATELAARGEAFAARLAAALGRAARVETVAATAPVGGGAMPGAELPGTAVALTPTRGSVDALAQRLRRGEPPVAGQIRDERLLLHLRTVEPAQEEALLRALVAACTAAPDAP